MAVEATGKRKIFPGEVIAKIIWIIAAVSLGIYAIAVLSSIGSEIEDTADGIKNAICLIAYFLAYVLGILYLFMKKKKNFILFSAALYAAGYVLKLIFNLTGGSRIAANDLIVQILNAAAYILFIFYAAVLTKKTPASAFSVCLKLWYLPALLLCLIGLCGALWTEFVRPAGFLWDGFFLDFIMAVILTVPYFIMLLVLRHRALESE